METGDKVYLVHATFSIVARNEDQAKLAAMQEIENGIEDRCEFEEIASYSQVRAGSKFLYMFNRLQPTASSDEREFATRAMLMATGNQFSAFSFVEIYGWIVHDLDMNREAIAAEVDPMFAK